MKIVLYLGPRDGEEMEVERSTDVVAFTTDPFTDPPRRSNYLPTAQYDSGGRRIYRHQEVTDHV